MHLFLLNPTYVGSLVYGKKKVQIQRTYDENYNISKSKKIVKSNDPIIVENCHELIINNDTFLRANELMKKRNKQQIVRIGKNIH
ncbi:recombinase family protein [Brevibacillus laterosporus]|uniref:recombinase family protein n=1 Tax=Brevibacillus laterosporus TaxID=1465 RepID=UPI001443C798|nr:hypothetical protein [Brevibacillus laterosporus]